MVQVILLSGKMVTHGTTDLHKGTRGSENDDSSGQYIKLYNYCSNLFKI